jgi:glutamyl-tRNA synthetase
LIARDGAYRCDCAPERLEALRKEQAANKQPIGYDRSCRKKTPGQVDPTRPHVVRLKVPMEGTLSVHDLVKGDVTFDLRGVDDAVLVKSDGLPTYHFAVVVDDHGMQISHAIRADEWLASTPKHILIYQAYGWEMPEFAHVPDVLAADGKKLSKRHGATSISEFRKMGFLPEALLQFSGLLASARVKAKSKKSFHAKS